MECQFSRDENVGSVIFNWTNPLGLHMCTAHSPYEITEAFATLCNGRIPHSDAMQEFFCTRYDKCGLRNYQFLKNVLSNDGVFCLIPSTLGISYHPLMDNWVDFLNTDRKIGKKYMKDLRKISVLRVNEDPGSITKFQLSDYNGMLQFHSLLETFPMQIVK